MDMEKNKIDEFDVNLILPIGNITVANWKT
jgi:hypothetical protein